MASKLQASFQALYAALEIPRVARRTVVVLVLVHTALLAYSAYIHSPTLNEPGHLVAGLSYWKFGRFDVYNVNPPLVRMVAALPVIAVGCNEDWSGYYEGPGARPEIGMGEDFMVANGEKSFFLFTIARWASIPFSWIGAIVVYLWARDLYGRPSGVTACAIWCFEPNILAHASLITTDAAGAALGIAACYTFWRWLRRPTWAQAALTGVVLGCAELAKTTLIIFYPLWPLMWLAYRWPERHAMAVSDWSREAAMVAVRMLVGLYVVNLGYGFEGSFTQLREFQFVSDLFASSPDHAGHGAAEPNRFADTLVGVLPVPLPKNYLVGIDIQQRDFEHYGKPSYLRGEWRDQGWWYYYIYACAIKVPLGLWLLGMLTVAYRLLPISLAKGWNNSEQRWIQGFGNQRVAASRRDELALLAPPVIILIVVSSKTGFSEHLRYALPIFPFAFIWVSQVAGIWCLTDAGMGVNYPSMGRRSARYRVWPSLLVGAVGCWFVASSFWVYPHSLSYFNESVGGPLNGPKHLLGSNVDWGQDFAYLRSYAANAPTSVGRASQRVFLTSHASRLEISVLERLAWATVSKRTVNRLTVDQTGYAVGADVLFGCPWIVGQQHGPVAATLIAKLSCGTPDLRVAYSMYVFGN